MTIQRNQGSDVVRRVKRMGCPSPREIRAEIHRHGFRGQEAAVRAIAVMAYRHVRRLRHVIVDGNAPDTSRNNFLLAGPTGSGKSHLVHILFSKILDCPCVTVDATQFSEVGYVGRDVADILAQLHNAADGDILLAAAGCVLIDEIDKLNAVPSPGGRDVGGTGVQRGLLALMSGSSSQFSLRRGDPPITFPTSCLTVVGAGAFSGLIGPDARPPARRITGFAPPPAEPNGDVCGSNREAVGIRDYFKWGMIPELMGRFNTIIQLGPLPKETLLAILRDTTLKVQAEEFRKESLDLVVDGDVQDYLIDQALARETGARGLDSVVAELLDPVKFDCFGAEPQAGSPARVRVRMSANNTPVVDVDSAVLAAR